MNDDSSAESDQLTRMLVEGFEPVDPPPDVWHRIDTRLWGEPESRHRTRLVRYLAVAAATVVLIGMIGSLVGIASRNASDFEPAIAAQGIVLRELSDPTTGDVALTIRTSSDGSSTAVSAGSLPVLEGASTYQLWSVVGDEIVSVGVFGPSIDSAPLRLEGDPSVLALTIEATGGVAVSTATPVAVWTATG